MTITLPTYVDRYRHISTYTYSHYTQINIFVSMCCSQNQLKILERRRKDKFYITRVQNSLCNTYFISPGDFLKKLLIYKQ